MLKTGITNTPVLSSIAAKPAVPSAMQSMINKNAKRKAPEINEITRSLLVNFLNCGIANGNKVSEANPNLIKFIMDCVISLSSIT